MMLQKFPENYELLGSLSSQFAQVSEAVPPPMAYAVALSIAEQMRRYMAQHAQHAQHGATRIPYRRRVVSSYMSKLARRQLQRQS